MGQNLSREDQSSKDTYHEPISMMQSRGEDISDPYVYEPLLQATIVRQILYSFMSIYLDRAEQGVETLAVGWELSSSFT